MTKIVLHYNLSETARRTELAAGRPAHRGRTFELDPTPELARIAEIADDGSAKIRRHSTNVSERGETETGAHVHGYAVVRHEADRVLSDQADACLFLTECRTAVDAKCRELKTQFAEREARCAAERDRRSAEILALTADLWDADGCKLDNAAGIPSGECSTEAEQHRKALWAEREHRAAAARERPETEARAWAAENGEAALGSLPLQRAAREGKKVRSEISRLVEERVRTAVAEAAGAAGAVSEHYTWRERDNVPSDEAYHLYDQLCTRISSIVRAMALPSEDVEVGPIARIDIAMSGDEDWRTGVMVTCRHPWLTETIEVAVLCASEAGERNEEENA